MCRLNKERDNEIMEQIIVISIIAIGTLLIFINHKKLRKGEWKYPNDHSYKKAILIFFVSICVDFSICIFVFILSKSLELSIGIGAFLVFYSLSAFLRSLLSEKHIKDRLKVEELEKNRRQTFKN
jgi:hypothetical protein